MICVYRVDSTMLEREMLLEREVKEARDEARQAGEEAEQLQMVLFSARSDKSRSSQEASVLSLQVGCQ